MRDARSPLRLSQWFDGASQLKHHFFSRRADELFLFAGPALPLDDEVLLRVAFHDSEQTCVLRGRSRAHETGRVPGTWLAFPTQEMVRGLIGAATVLSRRSHRFPTDVQLRARSQGGTSDCQLVELSYGGARLRGVKLPLQPGDEFEVERLPADGATVPLDTVQLVWDRGLEVGVRFRRRGPGAREAIVGLLQESKEAWLGAPEARHPQSCRCDIDPLAVWEPPAPDERVLPSSSSSP
jgi:hypothetical protein